jgi:chemotaxis protein methyltransferase CheR
MARDYFTLRGKTVYAVNTDKAAKTGAAGEGQPRQVSP